MTVSERAIKNAFYEQLKVPSSSVRSCFIMRNPPITEVTKAHACYAFVELNSTHEATQVVDRIHGKPFVIEGKQVLIGIQLIKMLVFSTLKRPPSPLPNTHLPL